MTDELPVELPETADELLPLLGHDEPKVRAAALGALAGLEPELAVGAAARKLKDFAPEVREVAVKLLATEARPELLDGVLPVALGDYDRQAADALRVLASWGLRRAGAAVLFGLISLDDPVSEAARAAFTWEPRAAALATLEEEGFELSGVGGDDIARDEREVAVTTLLATPELLGDTLAIAAEAVESENWSIRQNAAQALAAAPGRQTVDLLRALCDDDDEDVRREALRGYARCDEPGVVAMVLTALSDEDEDVRETASSIVDDPRSHPRLAAIEALWGPGSLALQRERLDEVLKWGDAAGQAFLRQRIEIVGWRGGAGRTHFAKAGRDKVRIEVNVSPLFEAGPAGEDVVKGVIVHEFGHHAYDYRAPGFKTASGQARARGAGPLWNIMLDERLERRLRSERPHWGPLVDRMNAWLIQGRPQRVKLGLLADAAGMSAEELAEAIEHGRLPGAVAPPPPSLPDLAVAEREVTLGPWDAVSIPGLLPPLHSFFLGLMAVRDHTRIADDGARAALALIPADLKDMPHGKLARLTLKIASLLGIDDGGRRQRQRFARLCGRYGPMMGGVRRLMDRAQQARPSGTWTTSSSAREISARLQGRAGPVLRAAPPPRAAPKSRKQRGLPSSMLNLGAELEFPDLAYETELPHDLAGAARIRAGIRPYIRVLRAHFEQLGRSTTEHYASRRGRRLDMARVRDLALLGRPDALVHSEEIIAPDAYLGLLIDRSGSMQIGDRMPLARRFGVLLAEAARGLRGLEGHISAFDGTTFYRLGNFQRHGIASLTADDGNNDSGALLRAAQLALSSRRKNRLIVMISDGSPAECSTSSLRNLVGVLERRHGIACAQVAVAPILEVCFPHFLDVSGKPTGEAVRQFGRLLVRLTRSWR
jgi:HEAT repeat protein